LLYLLAEQLQAVKKMLRTIAMATGLVVACMSQSSAEEPPPAPERLSGEEIQALAPGEYVGTWKGKKQLHIFLSEDGTLHGTVNGKPQKGKWHIKDEKLCIQFRVLFIETVRCDAVYRQAEWLVSFNKKRESRIRLTRVEQGTATASTIPIPKLKPVIGSASE
jgi:hypothetical protein